LKKGSILHVADLYVDNGEQITLIEDRLSDVIDEDERSERNGDNKSKIYVLLRIMYIKGSR